jgi:hypothetical protein
MPTIPLRLCAFARIKKSAAAGFAKIKIRRGGHLVQVQETNSLIYFNYVRLFSVQL